MLLAGWLWSAAALAQTCVPGGSVTVLGNAGRVTTLAPGTYTSNYQVVGDLLLTNGTYTFQGATFYVDGQASKVPQRQVTGCTITLGVNAALTLDGATLTAAGGSASCPMWRGLVLNHQGQGPSGTYRLVVQNNSTISHALCGIDIQDTGYSNSGTSNYLLDHSTFANNLTHVRDATPHPSTQPSLITNCAFNSDPAQMHFPYEQDIAAGVKYYTYQALLLLPLGVVPTPLGNLPSNAIEVRNNTFNQAVYGIVNNMYDRAAVLIQDNILNKVFQTGIWTVNTYSNQGTSLPVTSGNTVNMNVYPPQNTDQIDPAATVFGIVGEDTRQHNAFVANRIVGDKAGTKPLVGLSISLQTDVSGNIIENVNEGIRTTALDGSEIFDNRTSNCDAAFVVQPSPNGMYQVNRLGCNTFSQGNGGATGNAVGILVQQDATINDIGSFGNPAANQFNGLAYGIENDANTPVTYYQTSSPQEAPTVGGLGIVMLYTARIRNLNLYCFNQGATHYNGVNRTTGLSASYLAATMDSVRRQLVPPARYRSYLYEAVSYHARTNQLAALETWWATLAVPNAAAYRTVGRYLLGAYDAQRAAAAAQRILIGLQPQTLLNAELAAQLQLRAVVRHLPQTMPRLVAADSVVLRTLAWSGTSVAESATRWLRYYHPRIALPTPAPTPAAPRLASARKTVRAESGAVLSAAYPNPAQTEVIIRCQLAREDQQAELRFTNLLTGKVVLVVPVEGAGTERSQRVALASLPAGQYACQLLVEGQLAASPQRLTVQP